MTSELTIYPKLTYILNYDIGTAIAPNCINVFEIFINIVILLHAFYKEM